MRESRSTHAIARTLVWAALLALAPGAGSAQAPIEVVIATGDPLPGADPPSEPFETSSAPVINEAGQVAFWSPGATFSTSLYRSNPSSGEIARIVAPGASLPGMSDGIAGLNSAFTTLNRAGETLFAPDVVTPDRSGLYRSDGVETVESVQFDDPVPGGDGTFGGLSYGILNDAGQVAFRGDLEGTSGGLADDQGLFRGDGATLTQIVREGAPAPGGNGSFESFSGFAFDAAGRIAFAAFLAGTSAGLDDDTGIFRADGTPGGTVAIAREGEAVPGGDGAFWDFHVDTLQMNDFGEVAFRALLRDTASGSFSDEAIFLGDGARPLREIARKGELVPDGPGTFASLNHLRLNRRGQVAFLAGVAGAPDSAEGIFRTVGRNGPPKAVVRTGQPGPNGGGSFGFLDAPLLSARGQVAFVGYLDEGYGIFMTGRGGLLQELVRTGDSLLGSPIVELTLLSAQAIYPDGSPLNDRGELAFAFSLEDSRSGIAIAVPEPRAGAALAAVLALLGRARIARARPGRSA